MERRIRLRHVGLVVLCCAFALPTHGQGVLLLHDGPYRLPRPILRPRPEPTAHYRVKEVEIAARIEGQTAVVRVDQTFVNEGDRQIEAQFVFPVPREAAVEELTLMIDGKEHPARLLPASEARGRYEEIVRKSRDPALMEWLDWGMVQTSLFPIPPGAQRTVSLKYTVLCRSDAGVVEFLAPLRGARYSCGAVERLRVSVSLVGAEPLKNLYSPSHDVTIERSGERRAEVVFEAKNVVPESDFRLFFDYANDPLSARLLSHRPTGEADGYFLLLASPQIDAADAPVQPKTVVFVLDRSGSMAGKKIEQAQAALKFVLGNLREGDLFNIVAYDSVVDSYQPELQRYDAASGADARRYVDSIRAGGGTNIHDALSTALAAAGDSQRPTYVVFLTDGLPTAGETNESRIVAATTKANTADARVFTFGVGFDVNGRLLDRLAREGSGVSHYVRPDDDIESEVAKLYGKIESPVLHDAKIEILLGSGVRSPVNRMYPQEVRDLFAGEQLVLAGRYSDSGAVRIVVTGQVGDERQRYEFAGELAEPAATSRHTFVKTLWAVRRIGDLIDELDLNGHNEELVDELVKLSTEHGILTPYTSFLAEEDVRVRDFAANAAQAQVRLERSLSEVDGRFGFEQRELKNDLQYAARPDAYGAGGYGRALRVAQLGAPIAGEAAPAAGRPVQLSLVEDADALTTEFAATSTPVMNVGGKTFYRRGERWEDAELTDEQRDAAIVVERFSDEYFQLAARFGEAAGEVLACDEAVILVLDGRAYDVAAK